MSATFNITGLQEKSPKLETSQNGKKYLKVSLTVTSSDNRKSWFNNIMLWESMAEDYAKKTKEGQEIELTGDIYIKMETDQQGKKKATIALSVKKFKVLSSKEEESQEEDQSMNSDFDFDADSLMDNENKE